MTPTEIKYRLPCCILFAARPRTNQQLSQALSEIRSAVRGAGDPLTVKIERLIAGDESVRDQVESALDQLDADAD